MNLRCTTQRRFYYGSRTSARKKRVLSYGTELCGRIRQTAHAVEIHGSNRKGKQKACRKNAFRSSCRKRSRIRGKSDRTKHRQSPCGHDPFHCISAWLAGNDEKECGGNHLRGVCNGDQKQDHSVLWRTPSRTGAVRGDTKTHTGLLHLRIDGARCFRKHGHTSSCQYP